MIHVPCNRLAAIVGRRRGYGLALGFGAEQILAKR
jgi:hypothetical protein